MSRQGDADARSAGGAEYSTTTTSRGGFCAMKALSTRNDEPEKASRPWDRDRDGFVMGDGAGILVLEDYDKAVARGARIYCELIGFGMSGDAFHMTAPSESGEGAARRSEEHTSEIQSLMRKSYAVFCLKKQKKKHTYKRQIKQLKR